jgi:hypothetical protein
LTKKNPMFYARTKHIDLQYHFVRETVGDGLIVLEKIHTNDNIGDILAKHIAREEFLWA